VEGRLLDVVPAECVIETNCLFTHGPAIRCAHFYFGRECHLGNRCDFAHVIHLSEKPVQPWEKAPQPSTFGRGKTGRSADAEYYGENQYLIARNEAPPPPLPQFLEDKYLLRVKSPNPKSLSGSKARDVRGGGSSITDLPEFRASGSRFPTSTKEAALEPDIAGAGSREASPLETSISPQASLASLPPGTILLVPPAGFECLSVGGAALAATMGVDDTIMTV